MIEVVIGFNKMDFNCRHQKYFWQIETFQWIWIKFWLKFIIVLDLQQNFAFLKCKWRFFLNGKRAEIMSLALMQLGTTLDLHLDSITWGFLGFIFSNALGTFWREQCLRISSFLKFYRHSKLASLSWHHHLEIDFMGSVRILISF